MLSCALSRDETRSTGSYFHDLAQLRQNGQDVLDFESPEPNPITLIALPLKIIGMNMR